MAAMKNILIAVIGSGEATLKELKLAEAVGKEIASNGAVLICGGMGGVMEAACRGASSANGVTIGVLPGSSRDDANPFVQIPIVTGMGQARNVIVVSSAQAVIAIGGSFGTLSEIGHALRAGIPVIGLSTWTLCRDGEQSPDITYIENPVDAVKIALNPAKNSRLSKP
jgi:uncharacterized protein (TIGR00725 family)